MDEKEFSESPETRELKSQIAENRPRDSHGHFIHKETQPITNNQSPITHSNPFSQFLRNQTTVHKGNDDELVDIHIGNPLRKIQTLLEDIKRQKAFSFTLKGSLGIMGVVLVAGTFGILGGSKALCDKGTQTKIGQIRELTYKENSEKTFIDYIPFLESYFPERKIPRKILIDNTGKVTHLVLKNNISLPNSQLPSSDSYFATGSYDTCSETLTVTDQTGVQQLFR